MKLVSRRIPEVSMKDSPRRWPLAIGGKYPNHRAFVLIRKMSDTHLLNAIQWAIRRKGHRPRKFPALVNEAIKRKLPLPEHKWVKLPQNYTPKKGWAHVTTKNLGEHITKGTGRGVSSTIIDEFGGYNPALRD